MSDAGRKIALKSSHIPKVRSAVKSGMPNKIVASMIGVSEKTFYTYINKAEKIQELIAENENYDLSKEDDLLLQFLQALNEGRQELIERNLLLIQVAASEPRHWMAAANSPVPTIIIR